MRSVARGAPDLFDMNFLEDFTGAAVDNRDIHIES
jgi:hypothetical protein